MKLNEVATEVLTVACDEFGSVEGGTLIIDVIDGVVRAFRRSEDWTLRARVETLREKIRNYLPRDTPDERRLDESFIKYLDEVLQGPKERSA